MRPHRKKRKKPPDFGSVCSKVGIKRNSVSNLKGFSVDCFLSAIIRLQMPLNPNGHLIVHRSRLVVLDLFDFLEAKTKYLINGCDSGIIFQPLTPFINSGVMQFMRSHETPEFSQHCCSMMAISGRGQFSAQIIGKCFIWWLAAAKWWGVTIWCRLFSFSSSSTTLFLPALNLLWRPCPPFITGCIISTLFGILSAVFWLSQDVLIVFCPNRILCPSWVVFCSCLFRICRVFVVPLWLGVDPAYTVLLLSLFNVWYWLLLCVLPKGVVSLLSFVLLKVHCYTDREFLPHKSFVGDECWLTFSSCFCEYCFEWIILCLHLYVFFISSVNVESILHDGMVLRLFSPFYSINLEDIHLLDYFLVVCYLQNLGWWFYGMVRVFDSTPKFWCKSFQMFGMLGFSLFSVISVISLFSLFSCFFSLCSVIPWNFRFYLPFLCCNLLVFWVMEAWHVGIYYFLWHVPCSLLIWKSICLWMCPGIRYIHVIWTLSGKHCLVIIFGFSCLKWNLFLVSDLWLVYSEWLTWEFHYKLVQLLQGSSFHMMEFYPLTCLRIHLSLLMTHLQVLINVHFCTPLPCALGLPLYNFNCMAEATLWYLGWLLSYLWNNRHMRTRCLAWGWSLILPNRLKASQPLSICSKILQCGSFKHFNGYHIIGTFGHYLDLGFHSPCMLNFVTGLCISGWFQAMFVVDILWPGSKSFYFAVWSTTSPPTTLKHDGSKLKALLIVVPLWPLTVLLMMPIWQFVHFMSLVCNIHIWLVLNSRMSCNICGPPQFGFSLSSLWGRRGVNLYRSPLLSELRPPGNTGSLFSVTHSPPI